MHIQKSCIILLLVLGTLLLHAGAGPAMAGTLATPDIDGTPWDLSFDGIDLPTLPPEPGGFVNIAMNSSQYNADYNIGLGHLLGWLTSNGNPGGSYGVAHPTVTLQKALGWTVEWNFVTYNTQTIQSVFAFNDDSHMIRIDYAPNTVTLRDGYPEAGGGTGSVSATVDMSDISVAHTFRLVRQPDSDTIELYIDNDFSSPAAQITPFFVVNPIYADESNLNSIHLQSSIYEMSLDWIGLHAGATPPAIVYADVNEDGFVGGIDMTRVIVNWGLTGASYSQGDVNFDGTIGAADYNAVLGNWGAGTLPAEPLEAPGTIPEPGTLLLLAGGLLAGSIRRRQAIKQTVEG